jgi:2-polyprenyl-6-hydroxyphenyl methylase/3-demethylubiquinone-9 3-methyltransferase
MAIGPMIRKAFGPFENQIAQAYRAIYLSLDDYGAKLRELAPKATRILEVGGGEGAITEILARNYPEANILSIDIMPQVGRLYRGRTQGVEFRNAPVQKIAQSDAASFDLVILSDVVHHIPSELRSEILDAVFRCVAPGGLFVLKDWERTPSAIHWLCFASDRYLTGDRVSYLTAAEMKALVAKSVPALDPIQEQRIAPWNNNFALVYECPKST